MEYLKNKAKKIPTKKEKLLLEVKKQKKLRDFHRITDFSVGIFIGMLIALLIICSFITFLIPVNDIILFSFASIVLVTNSMTYFFSLRRE